MRFLCGFLLAGFLLFLMETAAAERYRDVGAAVATRAFSANLAFEDGRKGERRFRRAGVEYWVRLAEHAWMGFTIGYSENEGRDAARPFETIAGNYGSLGVRSDVPVNDRLLVRGRVEYLLQHDSHDSTRIEFDTRTRELRAEFGPVLRFDAVDVGIGASWRDLDFRETLRQADGDSVRYAEAVDTSGAFAFLGLRTDRQGGISLRYDAGAETGWALRFERTF